MSKRKYTTPGSIYKPATVDRLYIRFKGKTTATGLRPTREGYAFAKQMLENLYLASKGITKVAPPITYKHAWKEFEKTLVTKAIKTIIGYRLSYTTIISRDEDRLINVEDIEARILHYLKTTKHSKVSINTYLNQFQIFLNYCTNRKWIDKTNFKGRYAPKVAQGLALSYTPMECYRLIKYFFKARPEMGYLIFFMLETGARDVDALTLQWEQVDFEGRIITWKNKISKEDEARPISDKAVKILQRMQKDRKSKPFSWDYSSASSLSKVLNKAFKVLNIEKNNRSMQEFRVTFRMRMEARGMPEHYIEYLLRHSSGKLIYKNYTDFSRFDTEIRRYLNMNDLNSTQI